VHRAFQPEASELNSILDRGLGVCILAHTTEYLWRLQLCGYLVEELGHP
jgi:hypothetical protein